jgi:hypothetical protein
MRRITSYVREHPVGSGLAALIGIAVLSFGIYWFGPQYLFIDREVDEALPSVAPVADTSGGDEGGDEQGQEGAADGDAEAQAAPVTLAEGAFRDLAHASDGTARLIELSDGSRFVRFEDFSVDNGPDLFVYLSAAPASASPGELGAAFVNLGALKGNIGNQNYELGKNVDPAGYRSVVIWCRRFSVAFAVAPLEVG